jgi:hypothetical protein
MSNDQPVPVYETLAADPLLAAFVAALEETGGEATMTLYTNGACVSGIALPMAKFFERLLAGPNAAALREVSKSDSLAETAAEFIHLRDAKVLSGGKLTRVDYARIMVARVDGWSPGVLNQV